jgi:type II secretory pathway pseudopilin PulG
MKLNRHLRRRHGSQDGYILLFLIVLVTLMIIAMAAAVPQITTDIKRSKEEELIHRGHQYERAIQLYFRKFGRYPASIDQLESTNNMRFLRQRYKDPITGKDEWRIIHLGEAKPKRRPGYLAAAPGTPAAGAGQQPQTIGTSAAAISRPVSGTGSSIGGGPVVGIASISTAKSIKEVDDKDHYNEWEFTYDPTLDANRGTPGQPAGQPGQDRGIRGTRDIPTTPTGPK